MTSCPLYLTASGDREHNSKTPQLPPPPNMPARSLEINLNCGRLTSFGAFCKILMEPLKST